jgi:hypothetical protein
MWVPGSLVFLIPVVLISLQALSGPHAMRPAAAGTRSSNRPNLSRQPKSARSHAPISPPPAHQNL